MKTYKVTFEDAYGDNIVEKFSNVQEVSIEEGSLCLLKDGGLIAVFAPGRWSNIINAN